MPPKLLAQNSVGHLSSRGLIGAYLHPEPPLAGVAA